MTIVDDITEPRAYSKWYTAYQSAAIAFITGTNQNDNNEVFTGNITPTTDSTAASPRRLFLAGKSRLAAILHFAVCSGYTSLAQLSGLALSHYQGLVRSVDMVTGHFNYRQLARWGWSLSWFHRVTMNCCQLIQQNGLLTLNGLKGILIDWRRRMFVVGSSFYHN